MRSGLWGEGWIVGLGVDCGVRVDYRMNDQSDRPMLYLWGDG